METVRQAEQLVPESVTQTLEPYTPSIAPSLYLGIALGAMAVLLWSLMGVYMQSTEYRASSPAERLRRGDFRSHRAG